MLKLETLSDYQLDLILLLASNQYVAVTNEGQHFKAWMENGEGKKVSFLVRKDTLNKLYGINGPNWIVGIERKGMPSNHYAYTLTTQAKYVLERARGIQRKRIEQRTQRLQTHYSI